MLPARLYRTCAHSLRGALTFTLPLLLLSACAHYQLGPPQAPAYRSIYVAPVAVQGLVPQAQALLTENIRQALIRDGNLALSARQKADAILTVTLQDIARETGALQEADTGRAASSLLHLHAVMSLTDRATGEVILSEVPLHVETVALNEPGLIQAEYQAMPILAEQLALQVRNQILYPWSPSRHAGVDP